MFARRSILGAGLTAFFVPAAATLARAQSFDRSRDVIQAVATAKGQAENLLAVSLFTNLSPENSAAIEGAHERIFNAITGVVGGIPAEEAVIYAETAQVILGDQMFERGVALVPTMQTPVIPAASPEASSQDLPGIVADIINDAFGVKDLSGSQLTQVASDLALFDIAARLGGLIRQNNWALTAEFLRAVLTQLAASAQAIPALENAIGAQAVKEILTGASARFVLFVGWPILVATILFSAARRRDKLVAALEKAKL
jgi:hypothetical protein